ncbi:MAG: hypothetical protein HOP33_07140 [Verrucomicrobia bacterium]|nr:hypothetical protein [Verrucomicrobiota bacterium]
MEEPREISKSSRVTLWLVAWGVALAATTIPICIKSPEFFPYFVTSIWGFPIGTAAFAFPEHRNPPDGVVVASLVAGWLFYIALTIVGLYQKRRVRYFTVYTILCLLLILNAVGCNVNMMKGEWHM